MTKTSDPDLLAGNLLHWSRLARRMPPSWDGARVTVPVASPGGDYIGKLLPGRGLYVDMDLKQLGITRDLPGVFERTRFRRIEDHIARMVRAPDWDGLKIQGAAITTYDGIINSRAGGKANDVAIAKASLTTTTNQWSAMIRATGQPGALTFLATTPPTDAALDRTSAGAWSVGLYNPAAGEKKYLLTFGFTAVQQINVGMLVDILTHSGAFRLTVNTEEAITTPTAVTRQYTPTLGAGNLITFVLTTANSTTSHQLTIKYTNQAGTASQTFQTAAITTASPIDGLYPVNYGPFVPLAAGDFGVQSLKSTTSTVALAAGVAAGLVYFPLSFVPGIAGQSYIERDSTIQVDGLTELVQASSVIGYLNMFVLAAAAQTGIMAAFIRSCSG